RHVYSTSRVFLFLPPDLVLEIGPEFGGQVTRKVEAKLQRTLGESQLHRIEPVGIPLVRKVRGAVGASETPQGECLGSLVRVGENGTAERKSGAPQNSAADRAVIARILMQAGIQAKSQCAMDSRAGHCRSEALAVA